MAANFHAYPARSNNLNNSTNMSMARPLSASLPQPSGAKKLAKSLSRSISPSRSQMLRSRADSMRLNTKEQTIEDEYIRNLQQQIYLLELETRYLRESKKEGTHDFAGGDGRAGGENASAPLNDSIRNLKLKYVELQENHKQEIKRLQDSLEETRQKMSLQSLQIQHSEKEKEEMRREMRILRESVSAEKDGLFGEATSAKKKLETAQFEISRLENSIRRQLEEKEKILNAFNAAVNDAEKYKIQVAELLEVNSKARTKIEQLQNKNIALETKTDHLEEKYATLDIESFEKRIDELQKDKIGLQANVKKLELDLRQEKLFREKLSEDCAELVKSNATYKVETEELVKKLKREQEKTDEKIKRRANAIADIEQLRESSALLKDQLDVAKIALDSKDRRLEELMNKIATQENFNARAKENQTLLEERLHDLETRLSTQEAELVQLLQHKGNLEAEIAESKAHGQIKDTKLAAVLKERNVLQVELERYKREAAVREELENLKDTDFKTLMNTNLRVADSINVLMSHIQSINGGTGGSGGGTISSGESVS